MENGIKYLETRNPAPIFAYGRKIEDFIRFEIVETYEISLKK